MRQKMLKGSSTAGVQRSVDFFCFDNSVQQLWFKSKNFPVDVAAKANAKFHSLTPQIKLGALARKLLKVRSKSIKVPLHITKKHCKSILADYKVHLIENPKRVLVATKNGPSSTFVHQLNRTYLLGSYYKLLCCCRFFYYQYYYNSEYALKQLQSLQLLGI